MSNYGEMRSFLADFKSGDREVYEFRGLLVKLESRDLQKIAVEEFCRILAEKDGQDHRKAEYSVLFDWMSSSWKHVFFSELAEAVGSNFLALKYIKIVPVLEAGREISSYVQGDSYGAIITKVDSQKKIWVADLRAARQALEEGVALEDIPAQCWTRRQKRGNGQRGWATKGASIEVIRYSGLNFSGAVNRQDPHF